MAEKLKTIKRAGNLLFNPWATYRGISEQRARLKALLPDEQPIAEPQSFVDAEYVPIEKTDAEILHACKRLRYLTQVALVCSAFMLTVVLVSILYLIARPCLINAMLVMSCLCFTMMFFGVSLRYGFLAHGVENKMLFKYATPLSFAGAELGTFVRWAINKDFQSQAFFSSDNAR